MKEAIVRIRFKGRAADAAHYQIRQFIRDAIRREAEKWPDWRKRDVQMAKSEIEIIVHDDGCC